MRIRWEIDIRRQNIKNETSPHPHTHAHIQHITISLWWRIELQGCLWGQLWHLVHHSPCPKLGEVNPTRQKRLGFCRSILPTSSNFTLPGISSSTVPRELMAHNHHFTFLIPSYLRELDSTRTFLYFSNSFLLITHTLYVKSIDCFMGFMRMSA